MNGEPLANVAGFVRVMNHSVGTERFDMNGYLAASRHLALEEIQRFIPDDVRDDGGLYRLMLDYPLRPAKALRPALCFACCRALGGTTDAAVPSAAALELFHNAFLVHDDVEDGSHKRRHEPTLHRLHGIPMAVNVGDGMLALALDPLLDNVRVLGLGHGLRILQIFATMARRSAEGQMIELRWIRTERWDVTDREYIRMVHKKTGWYSFITPALVGAEAAGAHAGLRDTLGRFALLLGIAFQIQDDVLNLVGAEGEVGKEPYGDLWEGKYTLALLHTLRTVTEAERGEMLAILARARPADDLEIAPGTSAAGPRVYKSRADVQRLITLVTGRGGQSLEYARAVARRHVDRARRIFNRGLASLPESPHKSFLRSLIEYVTERVN